MKRTLAAVALLLLLAIPVLALTETEHEGSPEGEHHQSLVSQIAPYINFAILVGLLVYLTRKPMAEFLAQKREAIQKMLKDSEAARDAAVRKMDELQARLDGLQGEIDQIRANAEREAQAEKERLLQEAKEEARRILDATDKEVSNRVKLAMRELKAFAATEAVAQAEEIIKQNLGDENQESLINKYLDNLSRSS
ncbi:MAG: ATP synthase F0 subunit B [Acidobacteriota bacterium]